MKSTRFILSLFAIVALSACGGPPTESDGRKILEAKIQSQSNGLIKLVSFEKTNGVQMEHMGMKAYMMDFQAEIEFLDDCMWDGSAPSIFAGSFNAVRDQPSGNDSLSPAYAGKQKATKGQRHKGPGIFIFKKSEQGWSAD